MGIKFRCQSCDKKLHVKAFLAGKRGVCPYCGAKGCTFRRRVRRGRRAGPPADSQPIRPPNLLSKNQLPQQPPKKRDAQAKTLPRHQPRRPRPTQQVTRLPKSPDAVWYVRPPSGGQYGPADGAIMQRWLDEGRVGADSLVSREGWPDWKIATDVFASLRQPTAEGDGASSHGAAKQPVADPFSVVDKRSTAHRTLVRSSHRAVGRNVAILISLTVVCIALLIALYFVLRS